MLGLSVNKVLFMEETTRSVEKGSRLGVQCSYTQALTTESEPIDNSAAQQEKLEFCEGGATQKCWVTDSELKVAVHVLNCKLFMVLKI